jgi:hypothetical protein
MITVRNNDYVTHEASVKPGILAIDSPLHRLWRSFPRWGTLDNFDGVHFSSYAQFPLTGFAGAPLSREPFRVPFSSISKKTVRHKSHFHHGTYEAHCQKVPGLIDSIGKQVALLDRMAPRSGGRTNLSKRFKAVSTVNVQNDNQHDFKAYLGM